MFITLTRKELRAILLSPKFAVTLAVCSVLILLSVYTGIREYRASQAGWESATRLVDDQAREATSWRHLTYRALRKPDPMMIFVSGLQSDIGRWSAIDLSEAVKLRQSAYADDPIFAMFRMIDLSFIVQIILSLLAILFTYDAISGEREAGTLKLMLAGRVPRATCLMAKCAGAWIGLVVPILIPVLLTALVVMLYGIPFTTQHWIRLSVFIGLSIAFFTLFIVLGVFVSTLTRRSNVSFLLALVVWIVFVLIVPRAGMMAAGQMISVPRMAEIEGRRDGFARDLWKQHWDDMEKRFEEERQAAQGGGADFNSDEVMWARMMREDSLRKDVERRIEAYESDLLRDLSRRRTAQKRLAFALSRFSPASAYQLAAMSLAGTDVDLKGRYEEAMSQYRDTWGAFVKRRQEETGDMGGFVTVQIDSEKGVQIGTSRDDQAIDVSDMPRFAPPERSVGPVLAGILPDFAILALGTLLAFAGAFAAFLRYDVR